jgi:SulP family sulfate permease
MHALARFLPFLKWFPVKSDVLKADLIAGITVALVLIPQSMAYAQLAGLPAYYGLYAAFLPVMVASMWGSSAQLGTGPVAVVSLLTASSLAVFAVPGSPEFIGLAILLALLVGVVQLALGVFKLGVIVSFLSHPVIVGFTNAAAIIIGLSQVSKLFGVPMGRSEHFINDIWGVVLQIPQTHIPTFIMGAAALALMWGLRKKAPKLPGVLIAVVLTTLISWGVGFEQNSTGKVSEIVDMRAQDLVKERIETDQLLQDVRAALAIKSDELNRLKKNKDHAQAHDITTLEYEVDLLRLDELAKEEEVNQLKKKLAKYRFERVLLDDSGKALLYVAGTVPQGMQSDGHIWKIRKIHGDEFALIGGGEVVGSVPEGLPSVALPDFDLDKLRSLLATAFVISLVGFMEAISIAKAIAAKTKARLDPNQELMGQGLANLVGSFTQAFPVSGSFSRSAVNFNAGARTGMSAVFTGLVVMIVLLFLTPLLYHLPQAVLAAIIILAVAGLVNFEAVKHAWHASRHDGAAAIVTFVATLAFAPHLDNGIMVGAGLAIVLYLYRSMKPRVALLGRYHDGTLRDIKVNNLPQSKDVVVLRFDGSLYFANVPYFEDTILEAMADAPNARYLLVVGDAINEMDASGEEVVHHLVDRLREGGVTVVFSGLKKQVLDVMRHTGLFEKIGQANIFANEDMALESIHNRMGTDADSCPLFAPIGVVAPLAPKKGIE